MKVIEDYINGNLTSAKAGAKRHSWRKLFLALREQYGYGEAAAKAIADYLKGEGSYQAAADAEFADKK